MWRNDKTEDDIDLESEMVCGRKGAITAEMGSRELGANETGNGGEERRILI
jgi:hypothetical protein